MPHQQKIKLIYNFSSLSFIQATHFLLSVIVIPYVIRKVGATGFGVVTIAQVVMFHLAVLTEYGFNQSATRDIALSRSDNFKISKIFFAVLASKLVICVISFILLLILVWTVPIFNAHFSLYLVGFAFVIGQTLLINWFFQGIEKMHYIAIAALFGRIIFVILVFIFIKTTGDNSLFLFFMGIGNVIAGLASIYLAIRLFKLKFIKPSWSEIIHELKAGWRITATNFSITTSQYIGIFILRIFTDDTLVGYYSVAEKIFFGMKLMLGVFTQVVYPRVCQLMQSGWDKITSFFRQVYLPFLLLVILGCSIVFIFSSQIIHLFIGHKYAYSSFLLRMLCVATIIVCLNIPAYLVLFAGDHKKNYFRIFTMATVIYLAANIMLARFFDATGTVVSVIITEIFITAGLYREMYRLYGVKKLIKGFHKI
jgi:PST family polysaccharide transporter